MEIDPILFEGETIYKIKASLVKGMDNIFMNTKCQHSSCVFSIAAKREAADRLIEVKEDIKTLIGIDPKEVFFFSFKREPRVFKSKSMKFTVTI